MQQSRRDFFKGTLGLVGLLSGLPYSSVNLPTKAFEYFEYGVKREKIVRKLMKMGYQKCCAEDMMDFMKERLERR